MRTRCCGSAAGRASAGGDGASMRSVPRTLVLQTLERVVRVVVFGGCGGGVLVGWVASVWVWVGVCVGWLWWCLVGWCVLVWGWVCGGWVWWCWWWFVGGLGWLLVWLGFGVWWFGWRAWVWVGVVVGFGGLGWCGVCGLVWWLGGVVGCCGGLGCWRVRGVRRVRGFGVFEGAQGVRGCSEGSGCSWCSGCSRGCGGTLGYSGVPDRGELRVSPKRGGRVVTTGCGNPLVVVKSDLVR